MDFAGLDDWTEIFAGGIQTDSQGRQADGDQLIDRALATFDPAHHEPPVVVGHPKDNSPAFGWVEMLKPGQRDGKKVLMAQFKQVHPDFADLVKAGTYKKRSASFYPDGRLRHVGFLGGAPPAVKGLQDITWDHADEAESHEFTQSIEENKMDIKEFFEGLKFWRESMPEQKGIEIKAPQVPAAPDPKTIVFTEADIEKAKTDAVAAERQRLTLEFAETQRKAQQDARSATIKAEVTQMVASGKAVPAWVKSGMVEFMSGLDAETEFQFAEGAPKQKQLDWFRKFLADLPKVVEFKEIATRDTDASGDPAAKLDTLTKQKMAANKDLTYSAAFAEVQTENPDLAQEYVGTIS